MLLLLALFCVSALSFAQGTITSGGATFVRNTSGFDFSPSANFTGVTSGAGDQIFEYGWWYRVSGDTAETPFPNPTSQTYTGDTSTLVWTNVNSRGFDAREVCVVLGIATPVGGKVTCTMTITNPGATALVIDLFVMTDVDLGGTAGSDSVTVGIPQQRLDLTDSTVPDTAQFAGVSANALMVRPFNAVTDVAALLSDTAITNFDNSGVPATNFDFTGGFQWSLSVPAGSSRDAVTVVAFNTPALVLSADLSITKTDGVTTATPGGSVTYTITASNAGPDAAAATVADTFPAALTCTWTCAGAGGGTCTSAGLGNLNDSVNLPVGGSVTYSATCAISASASGSLSNTATVTSSVSDPVPGNNSATDTDSLVASADLSITKTDGVTSATPGGSVTYTITASNAGPSNANGAFVDDMLPTELNCNWTCAGAGGGTCTASGSSNINDTVNLPAGGSVTYTAVCAVAANATGSLVNTALITAPPTLVDPNPGNNSATDTDTFGASADLSVTITDSPDPVTAGGQITYTVTATNVGPSNAASAVMTISTPANTTFVSLVTPANWSCTYPSVGATGVINCNNASFNVTSSTFTLVVAVASTFSGTVSATANVSAATTDAVSGNNSANATTGVNVLTFVVTGAVSGMGGTISCTSPVAIGNTTTCTLTPSMGFVIGSVSGCGGVAGTTSPYTTGAINAACTVTATFVVGAVAVSTTVASGSGTISCTSPVTLGNTTTCVATPNAGFVLSSISGCGGVAGTANPYTTGVITAACTVTAVFVADIPNVIPTTGFSAIVLLTLVLGAIGALRRRRNS